ncbi:hypothetical protein AKJ16_DCAP06928 [Drosera capensis]
MSQANGALSWRGSWTSFFTRPIDTTASSNGCTVSKFGLAIRPSGRWKISGKLNKGRRVSSPPASFHVLQTIFLKKPGA